jgi:hypothetical protein
MVNTTICTGTLYLEGFTGASRTTMSLAYLPKNTPVPIYPANLLIYSASAAQQSAGQPGVATSMYSVQVTSGSVYLLA